jgi:soluble lytic murein transglycosylase
LVLNMPRISDNLYPLPEGELGRLPGGGANLRLDENLKPNAAMIYGGTAQKIGEIFQRQSDDQDDLRVEENINKLRERQLDLTLNPQSGYASQLGKNALERASGKPLTAEYMNQFETYTQDLTKGLATNRQREKFAARAGRLGVEFRSGLMRHESAQTKAYANQVDDGVFKVEVENAGRNWSDPGAVETALARIDNAVERKRQREGIAAELMTDVRRDARSAVHKSVLTQALGANNFQFVEGYLKNNATDMNAKDLLEVQKLYRTEDVANFAVQESSKIVGEAAIKSAPTPSNSLFNAMAQQESGNRQLKPNGQPVTSPKGAVGVMQVMPATGPEAAKLAGVPWDEKKLKFDEGYNRKLGEAYFNQQLTTYKGNVGMALAAYNAGPGAVDKAVAEAKGGNWLARLPKETQEYVARISADYASGVNPARPSLLDLEREGERRAGNDLEKRKAVTAEIRRQYSAVAAQRKQREDEVLDVAFKELDRNGGNFYALPMELRRNIPGDKLDSIHNFAKQSAKRAAGGDNETEPAAYFQLSDPKFLKGLSQEQFYGFRNALSETDFKHFSNEYRKANGQKADSKTGDLNSTEINRVVNTRLGSIGIDVAKARKAPTGHDAMRIGAIKQVVDQEIIAAQQVKGDKLTDAEIVEKVDKLFATDQKVREISTFGGVGEWQSRGKLLDTKMADLNALVENDPKKRTYKKYLEDQFKARGETPTEQDLLAMYLRMRVSQMPGR